MDGIWPKQKVDLEYKIDANFDRVFDEKDLEVDYVGGLNVAVLTSQCGFSCGGISPIYLHDQGFYTLGNYCGGGCCSIIGSHDIYGLYQQNSATEPVIDKRGRTIDEARFDCCDTPLEIKTKEDGSLDFSAFYDFNNVSKLIHEHAGK